MTVSVSAQQVGNLFRKKKKKKQFLYWFFFRFASKLLGMRRSAQRYTKDKLKVVEKYFLQFHAGSGKGKLRVKEINDINLLLLLSVSHDLERYSIFFFSFFSCHLMQHLSRVSTSRWQPQHSKRTIHKYLNFSFFIKRLLCIYIESLIVCSTMWAEAWQLSMHNFNFSLTNLNWMAIIKQKKKSMYSSVYT